MGTGLELVLVRHGRTLWNAERRFLGRTDLGLDEVGRVQARRLAVTPGVVGAAAIVSSPLRRAAQTAAAIGAVSMEDPDLAELHQGLLEGLDGPTAIARWPAFFAAWAHDPTGVVVPGGEALDVARDRALAALHRIAEEHEGRGRVVVVSHALILASVCATLAGEPLSAWRRHGFDHTARRRVRWHEGRLTLAGPVLAPTG